MTIALGLLVRGGVVLASDSQDSAPNAFKDFALKIHDATNERRWHGVNSCIAVTGTGPSVHIDAFCDRLVTSFSRDRASNLADLEVRLQSMLINFYASHVVAIAPHADRSFRLIIGAQVEGDSELWVTETNVLKRCSAFVAVGSGAPYAKMAIDALTHNLTKEAGVVLAALGVKEANEHDQFCGKGTQIVVLSDNKTAIPFPDTMQKAEDLIMQYQRLEHSIATYVLGQLDLSKDRQPKHHRMLSKWMKTMRTKCEKFTLA